MNKFSNFSDYTHDSSMFQEDETVSSKLALMEEMNYKDLMAAINPNQLPHRDYAPLIKLVKFVGVNQNIVKMFVPNKYNGWNTYFQFDQWYEALNDTSLNATEAAKLILWTSNLKFFCGCPSYSFHGYKYIDTQLGIAIVPETRFPHKMNPDLKNIMCKHGRRSLPVLGFMLPKLAKAIKEQRYADYIS